MVKFVTNPQSNGWSTNSVAFINEAAPWQASLVLKWVPHINLVFNQAPRPT